MIKYLQRNLIFKHILKLLRIMKLSNGLELNSLNLQNYNLLIITRSVIIYQKLAAPNTWRIQYCNNNWREIFPNEEYTVLNNNNCHVAFETVKPTH